MPEFIEYVLEDGSTLLVAAPEQAGGYAGQTSRGPADLQPARRFADALNTVKESARTLMAKLRDLQADEVEVEFSLTTTGEAGNFAVGKVGVEANYVVKLRWTNKPQPDQR